MSWMGRDARSWGFGDHTSRECLRQSHSNVNAVTKASSNSQRFQSRIGESIAGGIGSLAGNNWSIFPASSTARDGCRTTVNGCPAPAPPVEHPGTIRRSVSGISRQAIIRSAGRSVGVGIGLVGPGDLDYSPASHDQLRTGAMDYHLKPVGKICAHGGEPLEPSTVCVSVLIERDGQLLRLDYCEADWQGPPEGTVGQWRCTVPEPVVSSVLSIDPDSLMRYFERLADEPDDPAEPLQQKLRYVVAVMLWRKRRLKLAGSKMEGDREVLEFSGVRGEGQFDVLDCKLADDEIDELQDRLNEQLQREEWS